MLVSLVLRESNGPIVLYMNTLLIQVSSQLPVGTPSYLAPEVLRSLECSDGYGVECDWWSLGIIAYELMVGVTPFEGDTQKETYDNIMNYEVSCV